jgi:hypothetical protein
MLLSVNSDLRDLNASARFPSTRSRHFPSLRGQLTILCEASLQNPSPSSTKHRWRVFCSRAGNENLKAGDKELCERWVFKPQTHHSRAYHPNNPSTNRRNIPLLLQQMYPGFVNLNPPTGFRTLEVRFMLSITASWVTGEAAGENPCRPAWLWI